jgi:hypothetical protein
LAMRNSEAIQLVDVLDKERIPKAFKQAFLLAAAEKFLEGEERDKFITALGELEEPAHRLAQQVAFSEPMYKEDEVITLTTGYTGVVLVCSKLKEDGYQPLYGAWMPN